jgi:hypothetical protein
MEGSLRIAMRRSATRLRLPAMTDTPACGCALSYCAPDSSTLEGRRRRLSINLGTSVSRPRGTRSNAHFGAEPGNGARGLGIAPVTAGRSARYASTRRHRGPESAHSVYRMSRWPARFYKNSADPVTASPRVGCKALGPPALARTGNSPKRTYGRHGLRGNSVVGIKTTLAGQILRRGKVSGPARVASLGRPRSGCVVAQAPDVENMAQFQAASVGLGAPDRAERRVER